MNDKTFKEILNNIDNYFKDPKNVKDFNKYMKIELNKPCFSHLQCNTIWCKYNKPNNPEMGTITWCSKYKNNQEELCNKECSKRQWYELSIKDGGNNV